MNAHFTWYDLLGVNHHYTAVAAAMTVTALVVLVSIVARLALGSGEAAIQPSGTFSIKGFFEAFTEFMSNLSKQVLGEHGKVFIPHFGAIFFYVVFNNLFGLIPGSTAATANLNTALAIGLFSFVTYNLIGLKHGGLHYVQHFLGPVWWLAWLMLPIELISHMVRPISLGMRLSVNMSADHAILGTFLDLVPWVVPVIFYGMGTFVSLVQAFVFTMLSMVYVMMATADDH